MKAKQIRQSTIAIALVIVVISASITVSAATTYDFESYSPGTSNPGNWTGGDIDSKSIEGSRSLHLSSEEATNPTVENTNINALNASVTWAKINTNDISNIVFDNSTTDARLTVENHQGDWVWRIYDSGGNLADFHNEFGTTSGQWHNVEIVANSDYGTSAETEYRIYTWNYNDSKPTSPTSTLVASVDWEVDQITVESPTDHAYFDSISTEANDESQLSGTVENTENVSIENVDIDAKDSGGNVVSSTQTNAEGQYSFVLQDGEYTIEANGSSQGYTTETANVTLAGNTVQNFTLEQTEEELVIEVRKWMDQNTTQSYKGIYVPAQGYSIVTSELTVTSDNTSVVQVNETSNQLIAQSGVNNTANVTFEYRHFSITREITVADRTLEYIHILPSTQWPAAVLGLDDPNTEYGLGSEMQWIFVAIILSSLLAAISNNEWIGLGTNIISMVLLWILGNVGLGMVLATLFFGLFLGLTLMEVPRNKNTEITVENNNMR